MSPALISDEQNSDLLPGYQVKRSRDLSSMCKKKAWFLTVTALLACILTVAHYYRRHAITSYSQQRHVVYVRIPRTGSSTITRLMWRYGLEHNLTFLLPDLGVKRSTGLLEPSEFYLPKEGKFCDMMATIVQFNYDNYRPYFPPDVVFITLLRDPLSHLTSTIYHFDFVKNKIPSEQNKTDHFLKNPDKYEAGLRRSLTHNPVSEMLGLSKWDMTNDFKIKEFISYIEKRFGFVLILELLDESLLFTRKRFRWPMKNILYKQRYKNKTVKEIQNTVELEGKLREWSNADYKLYDYFKNKLLTEIKKAGSSFQEELTNYRLIMLKTEEFCGVGTTEDKARQLVFPETPFYKEFVISNQFCILRNKQGPELRQTIYNQHEKHNFCDGKP